MRRFALMAAGVCLLGVNGSAAQVPDKDTQAKLDALQKQLDPLQK
jgi:hypothetical protein